MDVDQTGTQPTPPAPSVPRPERARPELVERVEGASPKTFGGQLGIAAAAIVIIVVGTLWYDDTRQVAQLSREVAAMKETQQQLGQAIAKLQPGTVAPTTAALSPAVGQKISVAGAPARGGADAIVTLIEFSDYECPYCIRHFQQTMPQIDARYIKTGQIRYVFRDNPIDQLHPESIRAHVAARCALEQNKFWDLHVRLFTRPGSHQPADLEARAAEAGLNLSAFRACVASNKYVGAIHASGEQAGSLGANGTPAFFIGLRDPKTDEVTIIRALSGALPFKDFQAALDDAIAVAGKSK